MAKFIFFCCYIFIFTFQVQALEWSALGTKQQNVLKQFSSKWD